MTRDSAANADQIEYWNGQAGEKWVKEADQLDRMLSPFIEAVLEASPIAGGARVLDVGCGSGALSRAVMAAGAGEVTGVDVSAPMLALARERAEPGLPVSFVEADASSWKAAQPYDNLVSRFGVMFFADPVAAFVNLHGQMKPGARLAFACWQPLERNDWALAPLKAALPLAREKPEIPPAGTPGPFAFADADRTLSILAKAGWKETSIADWTGRIELPGSSVREAAAFAVNIGPTARLIAQQELDTEKVMAAIEAMMQAQAGDDGRVRLAASAWIVTARA